MREYPPVFLFLMFQAENKPGLSGLANNRAFRYAISTVSMVVPM